MMRWCCLPFFCFSNLPNILNIFNIHNNNIFNIHKNNVSHNNIYYTDTVRFVPPITEGVVVKVYDGDTITVASKLPYKESLLYRFSVRLRGIDAPEIVTKSSLPSSLTGEEMIKMVIEKKRGIQVRDILSDKILHRTVQLKNTGTEKYGRLLADVYLGDVHINAWMIQNKYAVEYYGGRKF